MLFLTNRVLKPSLKSEPGRTVRFDLKDANALQSLFFCRRTAAGKYVEVGSEAMLDELRASPYEQMLLFVHGFNNLPEDRIFSRAAALQMFLDEYRDKMALVVPIVWPCVNNDVNEADQTIARRYYFDQLAADASGFAFARSLERLKVWQEANCDAGRGCLKRINILAHSMGNRVLRQALNIWCKHFLNGSPPLIFRNVFMAAADVVNESLEPGGEGEAIPQASRNVVVYFASDDLALRASKVANVASGFASRRLGHTGPQDMLKVLRNVTAVDCDNLNTRYDPPVGHTYFLDESDPAQTKPGLLFEHMASCIDTGRVGDALPETTVPVQARLAVLAGT
jgi:esterase/lipase superfamily enzyme